MKKNELLEDIKSERERLIPCESYNQTTGPTRTNQSPFFGLW